MRYRMKNAFSTLLVSYVIMLILPCLFILQTYNQSLQMSEQACVSESLTALRQTQYSFDKRLELMDKVSMQMVIDNGAKAVMYYKKPRPGYQMVYQVMKFSEKLYDKLSPALDDLTGYRLFYKDNELVFYDKAITTGLEFYYNFSMSYEGMDYSEWYELMFTPIQRTLYPSQSIKIAGKSPFRAMIYIYPITKANGIESGGVIQFLISEDFVENSMNPANIDNKGVLYVLDSSGMPLCVLGSEDFVQPDISLMNEQEGYYYQNGANGKDIVVYRKSLNSGLIFASLMPESVVMQKAIDVKRTALAGIIILLLTEITMCVILARRNATPIINFAQNLRILFSDYQPANEYEFLQKSLPRVKSLQSAAKEKAHLEKRLFLDRLFEGRYKQLSEIIPLASDLGIALDGEGIGVIAFASGDKTEELYKLLSEEYNDGVLHPCIYHIFEADVLAAIYVINSHDDVHERICEDTKNQLALIKEALDFECAVGVGNIYPDCTDVCYSYNQARHSALKNGQGVIRYDDITPASSFYYPLTLEQKLISATRHREAMQLEDIFATLRHENFIERQLTPTMQKRFISGLESTLLRIYDELVFGRTAEEALTRINRSADVDTTLDTLCHEFLHVVQRPEEQKSAQHILFKQKFEEYLTTHYNDQALGVSVVSKAFDFSESYFSQFFKDVMDKSFSNYLENIRLTKAKDLICNSDMDIEQISVAVGYSSSTTFRRAFKRVVGMSPSGFKSANTSANLK